MMDIKLANTLFDDGVFSALYKAGFITAKVFVYVKYRLVMAETASHSAKVAQVVCFL